MTSGAQSKASTVQALVRGTTIALVVQLLVAGLALAATVFALLETQRLRSETAELRGEVSVLQEDRAKLQQSISGLADANSAASAGYRAWQIWLARQEPNQLSLARMSFELANESSPGNPIFLDQLAQISFAQSDEARAAQWSAAALQAARGESEEPALIYLARLAAYQCASGEADQARETIAGSEAVLSTDARSRELILQNCQGFLANELASAGVTPGAVATTRREEAAEAYKIRLVFLHIRNEAERERAQQLAGTLQQAGYTVRRIELVPRAYREGVRYYYNEQAAEAQRISAIVGEAIAHELPLRSLVGVYENLPRDRVEVWLPVATAAAPASE